MPPPSNHDLLTFEIFFSVIARLLDGGVSTIAESAFQHGLWSRGLGPMLESARIRVIRCAPPSEILRGRILSRLQREPERREAHQDQELLNKIDSGEAELSRHQELRIEGVPVLRVDTQDGYQPCLTEILEFIRSSESQSSEKDAAT